jgi:hypothetical protein
LFSQRCFHRAIEWIRRFETCWFLSADCLENYFCFLRTVSGFVNFSKCDASTGRVPFRIRW